MDRKKASLNITVGMIGRLLVLFIGLFSKSFLVRILGQEANGLYSLYVSVIGVLSIVDLGIGSAITFSMYRPIAKRDDNQISALYYLYKRIHFYLFWIILVIGLIITPFIPMMAKGTTGEINIYITYIVFLTATSLTYLLGHKMSFINAFKDNYVTTLVHSGKLLLESALQIVVLVLTKNFVYFLLVKVLANILEIIVVDIVFKKRYKHKVNDYKDLDENIKKEVIDNVKALSVYQIGATLINSFDSIIIGAFVGVNDLGLFSNYVLIAVSMNSVLSLIFDEITSIVGHQYVLVDKKRYYEQFKIAYIINFVVGVFFFLGYYSTSHELVEIIFGADQVIDNNIIIVITISYYINFMRRSQQLFKRASGVFHHDKYKPLIEGIVNIILSILLVKYIGIIGVLVATIITRLAISYTVDVYVLFKNRFEANMFKFYIIHYGTVICLTGLIFFFNVVNVFTIEQTLLRFIVNGILSVVITLLFFVIIYIGSNKFRDIINETIKDIIKKRKRDISEKI